MYTQSITRSHRTAFILAIDQSGSMAEKLLFRGRQTTKAEAVAEVTNRLLFELIERARRSDEVRDYYDIAVIGYSGDDEVYSLLPGGRELISVAELAAGEPPIKTEVIEYRLPDGSMPFGQEASLALKSSVNFYLPVERSHSFTVSTSTFNARAICSIGI